VRLFSFIKNLRRRSEIESDKKLVTEFDNRFGYLFQRSELLREALTHRSFFRAEEECPASNERLEFLGDSVLGLITAEHLHKTYPHFDEGDLTKAKAILVNEATLSRIGRECGLNAFIYISQEEEKTGGRERASIISDAVEAVIGAIYLDCGLNEAGKFVQRVLFSRAHEIFADSNQRNYKGELLELLQSRGSEPPQYEVVSEEGPDHEKTFKVVVRASGRITGTGTGSSKKEAEQKAASEALKVLSDGMEKGRPKIDSRDNSTSG
jgi:ribonuclease-3